jgi:hypothetical protein
MRETIAVLGAAMLGTAAATWATGAQAQSSPQISPYFQVQNQTDPSAPALTHPDVGYGVEDYYKGQVPAPTQSFELKVGTGYTQGFGNIVPNTTIHSVAGAGIGVNADFDYRISPRVSVGVAGQYQEFTAENNSASRGTSGNIGFTVHGAPFYRGDPWMRLGTGYRLLWSVNPVGGGPTVLTHGFELAALSLGYDLRLSEGVAIAPMIGADINMFVWSEAAGISARLSTVQLGTFVFAGLQGRFDAGPSVHPGGAMASLGSTSKTYW